MALNKRERSEQELYTGFLLGTPRGYVNPTKEEFGKMMGFEPSEDMKEFVYDDKDKDGNDRVTIFFWLQADTPEKPWFNAKFRLVNKPVISEQEEDGVKFTKEQWVNAVGDEFGSYWVDKEENLPDWFTHYQEGKKPDRKNVADKFYRKAIQGEADLNLFLNKWYAQVEFNKAIDGVYSTVLIDVKRLFRNVDKYVADEYQPLLDVQNSLDKLSADIEALTAEIDELPDDNTDKKTKRDEKNKLQEKRKTVVKESLLTGPVTALATVGHGTGEKEGEHYQNLYRGFLSGSMMKKVSFALSTGKWDGDIGLKKWHESATGKTKKGRYNIEDSYTLTMLQPFNPDQHLESSQETFRQSVSDAPQDMSY